MTSVEQGAEVVTPPPSPPKKNLLFYGNFINHSQSERRLYLWGAWLVLPCKWIVYCGEWRRIACAVNLHFNKSRQKPKI